MAETFLPTKEPELVIWYNNFQLKFAAYAPHCRTARSPPLSPPLPHHHALTSPPSPLSRFARSSQERGSLKTGISPLLMRNEWQGEGSGVR